MTMKDSFNVAKTSEETGNADTCYCENKIRCIVKIRIRKCWSDLIFHNADISARAKNCLEYSQYDSEW
jgi:hypothetical protein